MSKPFIKIASKSLWLIAIILTIVACNKLDSSYDSFEELPANNQLPKVLFITTVISGENGDLAEGIVLALQVLNREGAMVRLETRDVLYDREKLADYNMMILSTSLGYHDADRKYSLSFMSDREMENIRSFIEKGGTVIAGDNTGRNLPDGTDRITLYQKLHSGNYPLAECFGVELTEKNMKGYAIHGTGGDQFEGYFRKETPLDIWTLTPDSIISEKLEVMANWVSESDTIPAIFRNRYGKGSVYLLASSDFLHPANEGGLWSAAQIMDFYQFVLEDFRIKNDIPLQLNPWPAAYQYAFSITFNSAGSLEEYKRVLKLLKKQNVDPFIFVNGKVEEDVRGYLKKEGVALGSSGFSYQNYRHIKFPEAVNDILGNEESWEQNFSGFRFPFTTLGYWGLLALEEHGYTFESSIGANNLDFFHGSVFPHNIVMAQDQYYKTTDMQEVAPIYHDDYHFLNEMVDSDRYNPRKLEKDLLLYEKYLENYWTQAVKPYNSLMVYLGHPAYVGRNDTTVVVLENLINRVKKDNTWISEVPDIVKFRKDLARLKFYVFQEKDKIKVLVSGPQDVMVNQVSLKLRNKPEQVSALSGTVDLRNDSLTHYLIFDAFNGQVLTIE